MLEADEQVVVTAEPRAFGNQRYDMRGSYFRV